MNYETDNRLSRENQQSLELRIFCQPAPAAAKRAIASGCSFGGVGSDGGGSIRVPAHFLRHLWTEAHTGSHSVNWPLSARKLGAFGWLGVVGPMARTVADLRILFDVLKGPDSGDALTSPIQIHANRFARFETTAHRHSTGIPDALGRVTPETQLALRRAARLPQPTRLRAGTVATE